MYEENYAQVERCLGLSLKPQASATAGLHLCDVVLANSASVSSETLHPLTLNVRTNPLARPAPWDRAKPLTGFLQMNAPLACASCHWGMDNAFFCQSLRITITVHHPKPPCADIRQMPFTLSPLVQQLLRLRPAASLI